MKKKLYIRRRSNVVVTGTIARSTLGLDIREGAKGTWSPMGDDDGLYIFKTREARDKKIEELVKLGMKLVE